MLADARVFRAASAHVLALIGVTVKLLFRNERSGYFSNLAGGIEIRRTLLGVRPRRGQPYMRLIAMVPGAAKLTELRLHAISLTQRPLV
jgi:hypothetical protein